jgi:hypothetical protein
LEGIRIRFAENNNDYSAGQFFMLRKSLHDPIISLQIESISPEIARTNVVLPLLHLFSNQKDIQGQLDTSVLANY